MSAATPTRPARTVELTGVPAELATQIEVAWEQEHDEAPEGEMPMEYWTRARGVAERLAGLYSELYDILAGGSSLVSRVVLHAMSYEQGRVRLADEQILSEQRLVADLQCRRDEGTLSAELATMLAAKTRPAGGVASAPSSHP